MKRFSWLIVLAVAMLAVSCGYRYESVKGDKSATRIYTLDNGGFAWYNGSSIIARDKK